MTRKTLPGSAPLAAALGILLLCATATPLPADPGPTSRPATRAVRERLDADEQDAELLGRRATANAVLRARDRMAESQRRLERDTDAGARTQEVQRRILSDLDDLIDAFDKQRKRPTPPTDGPKVPAPPRRTDGPPESTPSLPNDNATPTRKSDRPTITGEPDRKQRTDFRERQEAFLQVSPRLRDAVIDGPTEHVSEKYRHLTEAYYKAVARAHDR